MATTEIEKRQPSPVDRLKTVIASQSVQQQFQNALSDNAPLFVASLIDLYASDSYLQQCEPSAVIMEALKAATLKLPINKNLGFAYIVPYKNKGGKQIPNFQVGYKGYIQLAMRTGQYRFLNAGALYEGHTVDRDLLTGEVKIYGKQTSDKVIAYFAYMQLLNGFSKALCWTKDEVIEHAKRFSKSYSHTSSPWKTDFDAMAIKTMIRNLLSRYGVMSVEMLTGLSSDMKDQPDFQAEADQNSNSEIIDIKATPSSNEMTDEEKAEILAGEQAANGVEEPDF